MNIEINTEKKPSISKRMFTLIRDVPGLNEEQVHEFMSKDMKYKTGSGKSLLYRMIRCKYIRKDKNGILHAHIDEYKAMPPFVKKKKKAVKVESGLAAAAKARQEQIVQYQAASNQLGKTIDSVVAALAHVQPAPAKKDFLRELGQRISSYFRP